MEPTQNLKYRVGDTVTYTTHAGESRTVLVTEKSPDIAYGKPGFDAVTDNGGGVWGYDSQITHVEPRPELKKG